MAAYGLTHDVAYEGTRGDSRPATIHAGRNNAAVITTGANDIPFGRFVTFDAGAGTSDLAIKPRSAAGQKNLGVLLHDMAHEFPYQGANVPGSVGLQPRDAIGSVMSQGAVWMMLENTATRGSDVYVRHTANGSPGASDGIGRVRSNSDGVAQVQTITPTAANAMIYVLRVSFASDGADFTFEAVGDGTATATEIVTAFKAVMAADAAFTARIVATGTTTLILTGQVAGDASVAISEGDGVLAVVNTTPALPLAEKEPRARFIDGGTIGQLVRVELNLP